MDIGDTVYINPRCFAHQGDAYGSGVEVLILPTMTLPSGQSTITRVIDMGHGRMLYGVNYTRPGAAPENYQLSTRCVNEYDAGGGSRSKKRTMRKTRRSKKKTRRSKKKVRRRR
jgi:hypothetical protein